MMSYIYFPTEKCKRKGWNARQGLKFHMDTFFRHFQFATLDDLDSLEWTIVASLLDALNLADDIHALEDFSENDVTSIKPTI